MLLMPKRTTRTLVSVRINTKVLERLDALAESLGRTRSELIDRAIEEHIERFTAAQPPEPPQRHPGRPRRADQDQAQGR